MKEYFGKSSRGFMTRRFRTRPETLVETTFGVNVIVDAPASTKYVHIQLTFSYDAIGKLRQWQTLNMTKDVALELAKELTTFANMITDETSNKTDAYIAAHSFNLITNELNY